jgi:hypothetical protein
MYIVHYANDVRDITVQHGLRHYVNNKICILSKTEHMLYQIRRPLGLVFVSSFVGWENCCRSIFRWTLICSSLPQSPDLLGFPGHIPPPHIESGTSLEP